MRHTSCLSVPGARGSGTAVRNARRPTGRLITSKYASQTEPRNAVVVVWEPDFVHLLMSGLLHGCYVVGAGISSPLSRALSSRRVESRFL